MTAPRPERRAHARQPCLLDRKPTLVYSREHGPQWAWVRDVSAGGLSLLVSAPLNPGTLVLVQLPSRARTRPLALLAEVVHAAPQPDGNCLTGCRYDNIDGDLTADERRMLCEALCGGSGLEGVRRSEVIPAPLAARIANPFAGLLQDRALPKVGAAGPADVLAGWPEGQAARLVEDLFDLLLLSRGKFRLRRERVNLGDVVSGACAALWPLFISRLQSVHANLPPAPVRAEADPARLGRALTNLLVCVAQSDKLGDRIWLEVRRVGPEAQIRIDGYGSREAAERLVRAEDLFGREGGTALARDSEAGVRLGLAGRVVRLHGGHVTAEASGHGTRGELVVHLPALSEG